MEYDLGIRADYLIPLSTDQKTKALDVLKDQFVGIKGSSIKTVTKFTDTLASSSKKFIHAKNKVLMPGLINGHNHLPMVLMRGIADDLTFDEWLMKTIIPIESKLVDEEFVQIGTNLAVLECIRLGVTTLNDMYYFEDVVADVADKAGLRGFFAEGILDFPTPDTKTDPSNAYRILEKMVEKYSKHERIHTSIAPHAPYTVSDAGFKKAKSFSDKHSIMLHTHVSETKTEVETSLKEFKKTPTQRLFDLGIMSERTVFAHGIHLSGADIDLLARTKTSVIHNPESNLKLGAGIAPLQKLFKGPVMVGLGTDGAASNNDLNMFCEMDVAAKMQKFIFGGNSPIKAKQILKMATSNGAKALGLKNVGKIAEGMLADMITVDLSEPSMHPIFNLVSNLVYASGNAVVNDVICHGKLLMENREFKTLDPEKIYSEAKRMQKKIETLLS